MKHIFRNGNDIVHGSSNRHEKKRSSNNAHRSSFPNMCGILFHKILNAYIILMFLRIK